MRLVFMRHADAASGSGYADDALRPLTEHGRHVQYAVAKALQQLGAHPDVILTSPRIRAEQTAWITAEAFHGQVDVVEIRELDGGFPVEDLLKRLEAYLDCHTVMCVGHEPDMTRWTNLLIADESEHVDGFSKSGVAGLQFNSMPARAGGEKVFFYRADELMATL